MNQKALQGALNAVKLGLKVIPLTPHTKRTRDGKEEWAKVVRIEKWPLLATDNPDQVKRWAQGDFTGTSSKSTKHCDYWGASLEGYIAFDTDAPEAKEALRNIFIRAGFPDIVPTYTTRTGGRGGNHFLYRQPEGYSLGNSAGDKGGIAPKLDTRGGAGGYIVLAGTANPVTRGEYTVVCDAEVATLPKEVAEIIKDRVSKARSRSSSEAVERRKGSLPDTPLKMKSAVDYLLNRDGGVEGAGGEADAVLVGRTLADIGISEDRAKELARAIYNPKCIPEWDGAELDVKVHNGYAYRESEIGSDDPDLTIGMFSEDCAGPVSESDLALFPIRNSAEFYLTPPPPKESLIENFMAHGKYLTLIYGRGGSGKSLLGWQMLRELIRGKSFLGLTPGKVCKNLRPLILSLEEPKGDVHNRYHKQSGRINPARSEQEKEPMWCDLRGVNPRFCKINRGNLEKDDGLDALIRIINADNINLVLIDSLSRIYPGNENDRAAVTAFGRLMDRLVEVGDCHCILLAHTNKAGVFSGSSAWEAICRQMFMISSERLDEQTVYTMMAEKTNEAERGALVRYRFDDWYYVPVGEEEYNGMLAKKAEEEPRRKHKASQGDLISRATEWITTILDREGELQFSVLRASVLSESGVKFSGGNFNHAISSMIDMGELIVEERRGKGGSPVKFVRLVSE